MASIIIYSVERRRLLSITTFEHKGVRCQFYSSKLGLRYFGRGIPISDMKVKRWIFNKEAEFVSSVQPDIMSSQLS